MAAQKGVRKEDLEKVEADIKQFALARGEAVVGFASVEDVNRYAPPGHRPTDFLEGACSVVVTGSALPAGAWRSPHPYTLEWGAFNLVGRGVALPLARHIEKAYGYYALPAPTTLGPGHIPPISNKLMAEMAGLGTRSLAAQIILNEEYGLLYFSAVITTLPLRATGPLTKTLCPHPMCTRMWERARATPCLRACPECLEGELEEGKIKWARYNQLTCFSRAQTYGPDIFQKMLLEIVNEPDPERRKFLAFSPHFSSIIRNISQGTIAAKCFECVRVCPIGYKYRYATMS